MGEDVEHPDGDQLVVQPVLLVEGAEALGRTAAAGAPRLAGGREGGWA